MDKVPTSSEKYPPQSGQINHINATQYSREPKYSCVACSYKTNDRSNYRKHLKSKRHIKRCNSSTNDVVSYCDIENKTTYECSICKFKTNDKAKLTRHLDTKRHNNNAQLLSKDTNNTVDQNLTTFIKDDQLAQFMNFTLHMLNAQKEEQKAEREQTNRIIQEQNKTILEVVKQVKQQTSQTTHNVAQHQSINNGIINNINVNVLNEHCGAAPTLTDYITKAISDDETISLIKDGMKFHEIFEHKVVRPMKNLACSYRPMLLVRQRTKGRRRNIFVKTNDGWEDDTSEKMYITDSIDKAAITLHQNLKSKCESGEIAIGPDAYMDMVFNVREPLLTDTKDDSIRNVMKVITDDLEINKEDIIDPT